MFRQGERLCANIMATHPQEHVTDVEERIRVSLQTHSTEMREGALILNIWIDAELHNLLANTSDRVPNCITQNSWSAAARMGALHDRLPQPPHPPMLTTFEDPDLCQPFKGPQLQRKETHLRCAHLEVLESCLRVCIHAPPHQPPVCHPSLCGITAPAADAKVCERGGWWFEHGALVLSSVRGMHLMGPPSVRMMRSRAALDIYKFNAKEASRIGAVHRGRSGAQRPE
eukprot:566442-Pelagomonas_calceolata.AAC.9